MQRIQHWNQDRHHQAAGQQQEEEEEEEAAHGATVSALGRLVRDCDQLAQTHHHCAGGQQTAAPSSTTPATSVGVSDSGALPFVKLMHALTEMTMVHAAMKPHSK